MERLVECVPNFSEGREPRTIQALIDAALTIEGVYLLDREMDADHHRSVLTLAGQPEAVGEAALRCAAVARDRIDLRKHQGAHPRVGATDVVPFIPIEGMTMDDCVALARHVAARIGGELDIPVYLYEHAASRPERTNLEVIRRGGLEGLDARIQTEDAWAPDFGPRRLHPTAGATVVGARPPLIAYNVNLRSTDLAVAKAIAKTVRFSSGGLPFVKAIGVDLSTRGLVQVSMNLTNFEETPIHVAFDAVKREAEGKGIEVVESEIVGLVPQQALTSTAEHVLKLAGFNPSQVLETRLRQALRARERSSSRDLSTPLATSLTPFLSSVAAGTPTPGGGSVAALAGALGASLGIMACRLGPPKSRAGDPNDQARSVLHATERKLLAASTRLQALIQADAESYEAVLDAYRLPKDDPRRSGTIDERLIGASEVPMETAELASEVGMLLLEVRHHAKPSVASDIRVGLIMSVAAMEGGIENARQNLKSVSNPDLARELGARLQAVEHSLVELKSVC